MCSLTLRFLIALITFAVSLMVVWLFNINFNSPPTTKSQSSNYVSKNKPEDYSKTFNASCSCKDFPSSAGADRALRGKLNSKELKCYNSGIIERGVKLNEQGQRVGKRVVANIGCGEEGQEFISIFWTEGSAFCEIQALTIYGALNYEKVWKP